MLRDVSIDIKALLQSCSYRIALSFVVLLMSVTVDAQIVIKGDVYGGGNKGEMGTSGSSDASTTVTINGTAVNNVYGGGLSGIVYGTTNVNISEENNQQESTSAINVYGGGRLAAVEGSTYVKMYDGLVKANIFGGGYGEGAYSLNTNVQMNGGTVTKSLFGGGEIASVGYAKVLVDGKIRTLDSTEEQIRLRKVGSTSVEMNGGLISENLFGGGRGYSYDSDSAMIFGTGLHSDGFVFGSIKVRVNGGNIGTEDAVLAGKANVFGGGDMGYLFTLDGTRAADGYWYKDGVLTHDIDVLVKPTTAPVKIGGAVYAGANVTMGSENLSADMKTVFGNVSATLVDVDGKLTVGADGIGGLYGDGNLTLVDGYRELNITDYGTSGSAKLLNTIQRADFCGIFNSNIELNGARDRVTTAADFTDYSINRVGEVSLNDGSHLNLYNVVNLMGGLTSDVDFQTDVRTTSNSSNAADGKTWVAWKEANVDAANRNDGTAVNKLSLSSGVWLELLKENNPEGKVYGPVTGVVELGLLNVKTGQGGGYVYAENIHGTRNSEVVSVNYLSDNNYNAISNKSYTFSNDLKAYQTSGNFVNAEKIIVDDCYPVKNSYSGENASPAHYWYIKGTEYVHNQLISAYTGGSQSFFTQLNLPFEQDANIQLVDIYNCYYAQSDVTIDNVTYLKGSPIDSYSYNQLTAEQKNFFADAPLPEDYNNMSSENAFLLTLDWTNPTAWSGNNPTYRMVGETSVFGQRDYTVGEIVVQTTIDNQNSLISSLGGNSLSGQAQFEKAYVANADTYVETADGSYRWVAKGSVISTKEFDINSAEVQTLFEPGYRCVASLFISENEEYLYNEIIPESIYNALSEENKESFLVSYVCTEDGKYGGQLFEKGKDYSALEWNALSVEERSNFSNNKSALDLLLGMEANDAKFKNKELLAANIVPIQTAKVYVPRSADINKLTTDRIVTAKYTYDNNGVAEDHYFNIRVHFESGVPTVGLLKEPRIILPGTTLSLLQPEVTAGAYEILGGGWELYTNQTDALLHSNGIDFKNSRTPLYWYQNGFYVAYYVKSYLGKTYSNAVPVRVANYHRMEDVLRDQNHMYVGNVYDEKRNLLMDRPSKIYIADNASNTSSYNELDYFQQFFALLKNAGQPGTNLSEDVKGGNYMEFILQSDIAPRRYTDWTPLGDDTQCFEADFHGDGYTISGLNNSLFGNLCGNVYNLGVTGSFTGSGVAEKGGNAYNTWVYTTATPENSVNAVMGTGLADNSYYYQGQYASAPQGATAAKVQDFLDGTVAYNLNKFYLLKRSGKSGGDGYPSEYVYNRYKDGDYIYSQGVIPELDDFRYDDATKSYNPIEDDYIFFGQNLSYDLVAGKVHAAHPGHINKQFDAGTVTKELDDEIVSYKKTDIINLSSPESNRVYRAPAYDLTTGTALERGIHYNRDAAFASTYNWNGVNYDIESRLLAIDFTGYSDTDNSTEYGTWLDFDGLNSFEQSGITQNLLIYADKSLYSDTYSVLETALPEPNLVFGDYNSVAIADAKGVKGHLVNRATAVTGYGVADRDHMLVDKQNFTAPIAFKYADDCRMWYQRKPAAFAIGVGHEGFEGLVLPFTADMVTTHQKGEITHFYGAEGENGHEYWLRGFTGVESVDDALEAQFVRPLQEGVGYDERNRSMDYQYGNRFLYDYYYSHNSGKDENEDIYQKYYNSDTTYIDYILASQNVPYAVAFPGRRYFEFDMSGQFEPQYTYGNAPAKLEQQVVTFVSENGAEIPVTPQVMETTVGNYSYYGTFVNETQLTDGVYYRINADGSGFVEVGNEAMVNWIVPFRTYMKKSGANGVPERTKGNVWDFIPFSPDSDSFEESLESAEGTIRIEVLEDAVRIVSTLESEVVITIYTVAGSPVGNYRIEPQSETIIPMPGSGIYIVNGKKVII